ncbi:MAG TPA: AtaL-like protein [Desulfuromonadaceae bacterium]|jgi:ribosome-associated toxin RatA of RatAB toxin-antitoxin module
MLITSYRTIVQAQTQTVWDLLLDRIENPRRFQPIIDQSKVLERFPLGVIREMTVDDTVIRERITIELGDYAINSELLEHPLYTGTTFTRIVPTSVQNPMAPVHLEIGLRLELKEKHREGLVEPEEDMEMAIKQELQAIKQQAEELESRETEPVGSEKRFRSPLGGG